MVSNIITPAEYRAAVSQGVHEKIGALTKEQNDRLKAVMRKIENAEREGAMMTRIAVADDIRIILNDISNEDFPGPTGSVNGGGTFPRGNGRIGSRPPKIDVED